MNDGQLNKTTRHKMDVTEMKMLRGMSEFTLVWFVGRGFDGSGSGSEGGCRSGSGGGNGVLMCRWCGVSVYGNEVFF